MLLEQALWLEDVISVFHVPFFSSFWRSRPLLTSPSPSVHRHLPQVILPPLLQCENSLSQRVSPSRLFFHILIAPPSPPTVLRSFFGSLALRLARPPGILFLFLKGLPIFPFIPVNLHRFLFSFPSALFPRSRWSKHDEPLPHPSPVFSPPVLSGKLRSQFFSFFPPPCRSDEPLPQIRAWLRLSFGRPSFSCFGLQARVFFAFFLSCA